MACLLGLLLVMADPMTPSQRPNPGVGLAPGAPDNSHGGLDSIKLCLEKNEKETKV